MDTRDSKTHQRDLPQTEKKHPDEWERDLNPDRLAGQNIGARSADQERGLRTAYEIKDVHRSLGDFSDDELRDIPILSDGMRLQQGATYVDLAAERPTPFTADGTMSVGAGQLVVPKDRVPYTLWNRLIGEEKEWTRKNN